MPIGLNHNTEIIRPNEDSIFEIGSIYGSARSTAPTGYLLCDGSLVSRTIYNRLFNAIGTTYGSGDGSTTFAIPDLVGAVPRGAGTSIDYKQDVTVTLGAKDDDAVQTHQHDLSRPIWVGQGSIGSFGANSDNSVVYGGYDYGSLEWGWSTNPLKINNNNERTATETKMKNVGVNFFIKF